MEDASEQTQVEEIPVAPVSGATKSELELTKLRLEIEALQRKRSFALKLLEYLPTLGQIVALCGLLWTVSVGRQQQVQQHQANIDSSFERAYSKLGSASASERASGVAQLSSLLFSIDAKRNREILSALVNQLALDDNPAVRSSIISIFIDLPQNLDQTMLNETLRDVIRDQRAVIEQSKLSAFDLGIAYRNDRNIFVLPRFTPESPERLLDANAARSVENATDLASILLILLRDKAKVTDMEGIFCPRCNFAWTEADLSDVNFNSAILPGSYWAKLHLERADFSFAQLQNAAFLSSNLTGANFAENESSDDHALLLRLASISNSYFFDRFSLSTSVYGSPDFNCANLHDASFDSLVVASTFNDPAVYKLPVDREELDSPFEMADVTGASFHDLRIITMMPKIKQAIPSPRAKEIFHLGKPSYVAVQDIDPFQGPKNGSRDAYEEKVRYLLAEAFTRTRNYRLAFIPTEIQKVMDSIPVKPGPAGSCDMLLDAGNPVATTNRQRLFKPSKIAP